MRQQKSAPKFNLMANLTESPSNPSNIPEKKKKKKNMQTNSTLKNLWYNGYALPDYKAFFDF